MGDIWFPMVILDFDGVIVDSVDEVIVNTYFELIGKAVREMGELPAHYAENYRVNRHHVQPAGDLLVLADWALGCKADAPIHVLSRAEYDALTQPRASTLTVRTEQFFAARKKLRSVLGDRWYEFNRPFQPLWECLSTIPSDEIFILTNKNRDAVVDLFRHFGKELPPKNVFAGDGGVTKIENLKKLCPPGAGLRPLFVDDSVHNLIELEEAFPRQIDLALATWGYLGPDDVALATAHGFAVFSQQDLIGRLRRESRA
jgi:phosphoglycolate phosphatase-like HAD superfamily hydrolase